MVEIGSRNLRGLMTDWISDLAILEVARIGRPLGRRIAHRLCLFSPQEFTGQKIWNKTKCPTACRGLHALPKRHTVGCAVLSALHVARLKSAGEPSHKATACRAADATGEAARRAAATAH